MKSTTSFFGKMRQNPSIRLILENQIKTSTTAPAQRRVCGLSTSMKNNNTPQRKGERWHNHNKTKQGENKNTMAQELFDDASKEVNDART